MKSGFTLVELLVSISIFVFMTALVMSRYGTFSQQTTLSNLAYDVALTIRQAQSYGLSVRGTDWSNDSSDFSSYYGVYFSPVSNNNFTLFSKLSSQSNTYDSSDPSSGTVVSNYVLKQGATILSLCVLASSSQDCNSSSNPFYGTGVDYRLTISFKRPDPNAVICISTPAGPCVLYNVAKITVRSADGSDTRSITISKAGQISVGN